MTKEDEFEEYKGVLMLLQDQTNEEKCLEVIRRYKVQILKQALPLHDKWMREQFKEIREKALKETKKPVIDWSKVDKETKDYYDMLTEKLGEVDMSDFLAKCKERTDEKQNPLKGLSDEQKAYTLILDGKIITRICPICKKGFPNSADAIEHSKRKRHFGDYNPPKINIRKSMGRKK